MRFLLCCFLAALLLGGCSRAPQKMAVPPNPASAFPSDDLGRAIKLSQPARRVVCIGPGATETIFALGAGEKLVGRDQFSNYPKAALQVPIAGNFEGPSPEKAIALRPDLIIVQGETYDAARAQMWEDKIGAPVAVLAATNVAQVAEGILKIGAWLGVNTSWAGAVANKLKGWDAQRTPDAPRAFFEISRSPLWAAGSGTLVNDMMKSAGLVNVAAEIQGYKPYSLEALLKANPDYYLLMDDKQTPEAARAALRRHAVLGKLPCVARGDIVVLSTDLISRPGPRLRQGWIQLLNLETGRGFASHGLPQSPSNQRQEPAKP